MKYLRFLLYIAIGAAGIFFLPYVSGLEKVAPLLEKYKQLTFGFSLLEGMCIFLVILWILSLVENVLHKIFTKITSKTTWDFDDKVLDIAFESFYSLKFFAALYFAWMTVDVGDKLNKMWDKFTSIAIIIIFLLFATRFFKLFFREKIMRHSKGKKLSKALMSFVEKTVVIFIWGFGAITILSNLGYNVSALVAGAGVGGIAIALAAQKTVANIFGAITVLLNRPYQIGDYITLGTHTGVVKDIGLTYTKLLDDQWYEVMITNETILSTVIENKSKREYRRADFAIGLVYDTTLPQMEKWVKIIEEILQKYIQDGRLENYRVNFEAFGDFSLNINVTYFSNTLEYLLFLKEKEQINLEIKKSFAKAKLEMAFPTQEMIIKSWELK